VHSGLIRYTFAAMESLLAETRRFVRERLLSSEGDTETLYALGLAVRELSLGLAPPA
jgi:hypothetical protein